MKKIILLFLFLLAVMVSYGQPNGNQQENNITIRNAQPMLHLRGEGAVINFYNGDLRLTRSPNVLTLTGGILKIGASDTAATQAYARSFGGGSTDIANQIHDSLSAGVDLQTIAPLLTDTIPGFTFGDGRGNAADTTGLYLGQDLGAWYNDGSDTAYVYIAHGGVKTSKNAPSVLVNFYVNDSLWITGAFKSDSLLNTAWTLDNTYGLDVTTSFDRNKVPPGRWVWVGIARTLGLGTKPAAIRGSVGIYKLRGHGRDE